MTYQDIENANKAIKTTDIKGKDYAEVNQRIKAFRMVHPEGTILTDLISNENGMCIFRATVSDKDGVVLGTGTAYEKENSSFINKTSYIENCETSAVGRALGMCGFGIDTSVASYEEVANAIENQDDKKPGKKTAKKTTKETYREKVMTKAKELGISLNELAKDYGLNATTTEARFKEVYEDLNGGK